MTQPSSTHLVPSSKTVLGRRVRLLVRAILTAGIINTCGLATRAQEPPLSPPVPPANPAKEPVAPGEPATAVAPVIIEPEEVKAPENLRQIINSLKQSDIQEAISALRANYIDQKALTEEELNRAALEGLIARLDHGAILEGADQPREEGATPFHAEVLDGRVGYIRLGELNAEALRLLDAALKTAAERSIPAVALDLRGTPESSDFELAEQVVSRFSTKGKPLFTIKRPGAQQEQIFTSKSDPTFSGFVVALVDSDTAGAVETIAGAIRQQSKSLVVGEITEGRAVEYSNVQLSNGRLMRVATGLVVLPPDKQIFPAGVIPDLIVSLKPEEQRTIFQQSLENGMSQFVFETERPRLNEAALVAGTNPSIDAYQQARRNPNAARSPLRDSVLQRALDVVTSIQVIEFKTGLPKTAGPVPGEAVQEPDAAMPAHDSSLGEAPEESD